MGQHSLHSSFREKLFEHLFVGELLKISWLDKECDLEVATPEVDNQGYDIIAECNGIVRHIQLKTSFTGSKTSTQKVHVSLAKKPSGCVVWIVFDESTLEMRPFLFFGNEAGLPLPDLSGFRIAKHTKGDKTGRKGERPNVRVVNKGQFEAIETIERLYGLLFGNRKKR